MTGGIICWNKTATIGALLLYERFGAIGFKIRLRERGRNMEGGTITLTAINLAQQVWHISSGKVGEECHLQGRTSTK
jgi:hypothetical protein